VRKECLQREKALLLKTRAERDERLEVVVGKLQDEHVAEVEAQEQRHLAEVARKEATWQQERAQLTATKSQMEEKCKAVCEAEKATCTQMATAERTLLTVQAELAAQVCITEIKIKEENIEDFHCVFYFMCAVRLFQVTHFTGLHRSGICGFLAVCEPTRKNRLSRPPV
jgi:hypothetical protein